MQERCGRVTRAAADEMRSVSSVCGGFYALDQSDRRAGAWSGSLEDGRAEEANKGMPRRMLRCLCRKGSDDGIGAHEGVYRTVRLVTTRPDPPHEPDGMML